MVPVFAGLLAAAMILFAALRGLRPRARFTERAFAGAVAGWSLLGAALYRPALLRGLAPAHLTANHTLVTVFGFGVLALGVLAATLIMGGSDH